MGSIILVTGGAKSGKSFFAERLVAGLGDRVVYVATLEVFDAEMSARVARHQARRPSGWTTVEAPRDLRSALEHVGAAADAVLVDCLTVWTSNHLLALGDPDAPHWWAAVEALEQRLAQELEALIAVARHAPWHLVLVTNEVGFGVVPYTPLGRAFRDLLGALTQRVSAQAQAVFLVVAGYGMEVKGSAVRPEDYARSEAVQQLHEG